MDESRSRFALRLLCFLGAAGAGINLASNYFTNFTEIIPGTALLFILLAACAVMSCFRTLHRLTAALFPAIILVMLVFIFSIGSGIHDPSSPAFVVIILVAALFLGKRGAVVYTGLSMLASGIVVFVEVSGLHRTPYATNWGTLVAFWIVTGLGGLLIWFLISELERRVLREMRTAAEVRALNATLEASVVEKEHLLRELQHRVKNNLQQLASLVSLGSGEREESAESVRRAAERRIQAMADLYDLVSEEDRITEIRLGGYLETVCRGALPPRGAGPMELDCDQGALAPPGKALLAGLLVAEFVATIVRDPARLSVQTVLRLSVHETARGTQVGLEFSNVSEEIVGLVERSGLGLLGILEEELGAAFSIDLEGREIAMSFLLAKEEPRSQRP